MIDRYSLMSSKSLNASRLISCLDDANVGRSLLAMDQYRQETSESGELGKRSAVADEAVIINI